MSIAFYIMAAVVWLAVVAVVWSLCEAGARADRKRWETETLAADEEQIMSQQDDLFSVWSFLDYRDAR